MWEDMQSGFNYHNTLEIMGLSYDDQPWAYGLGLYHFLKTRDYSNLMRDEHVLCWMISMGLYDDDETMNNLSSRRAMMHGVIMGEHLWELIRAECKRVGGNLTCNSVQPLIPAREITWNESWGMSRETSHPSPGRSTLFWRTWKSNWGPWENALINKTPLLRIALPSSFRRWMNALEERTLLSLGQECWTTMSRGSRLWRKWSASVLRPSLGPVGVGLVWICLSWWMKNSSRWMSLLHLHHCLPMGHRPLPNQSWLMRGERVKRSFMYRFLHAALSLRHTWVLSWRRPCNHV